MYKRPYDPLYPVVCDESPKLKETRPIPAASGRSQRYDYEYERCGVCNIFMASEWRACGSSKSDWAVFIKGIAGRYEDAIRITLVMDNLATHKAGSLYETFLPEEAKRILDRFEFVYTPKHGSWLNMAEIELNVLTGQCLNRRIETIKKVASEVEAWYQYRNNLNATVNWQFTTEKARVKLKRLYPTLNV